MFACISGHFIFLHRFDQAPEVSDKKKSAFFVLGQTFLILGIKKVNAQKLNTL